MSAGHTRNLDKILNSLTAISLANLGVDLTGRDQNDRDFCCRLLSRSYLLVSEILSYFDLVDNSIFFKGFSR